VELLKCAAYLIINNLSMLCTKLIYLILEDFLFVDIQKVTHTSSARCFSLDRCFTALITPSSDILWQLLIMRVSILGFFAASSKMPICVI
jgi:hypothetical protein